MRYPSGTSFPIIATIAATALVPMAASVNAAAAPRQLLGKSVAAMFVAAPLAASAKMYDKPNYGFAKAARK